MRAYFLNPPAAHGVKQVREGRCMQRAGAWTTVWTPISLATCAAVVRNEGFDVKLSDCVVEDIDFERVERIVAAYRPDLVVMNVVTPAIESDLSTVRLIKRIHPAAQVAVIGIHPTALPDHCFKICPDLDFAVRGEPEYTVRDIARALKSGGDRQRIIGASCRGNGSLIHSPPRPAIADLDELPFPAWDLIDRPRYVMPFSHNSFLLVGTGRGCPFPCTFCADKTYYGTRLRLRSPRSVVDELERNMREFGTEDFLFWSESFTMNRKFALEVCKEILGRGVRCRWVCNSRVDHVNAEMLRLFKKAGCTMIGYGVESGVQSVLDSIKKGVTLDQTREAVRLTRQAGIGVVAHCVLGFPGETVETITQTIEFLKKLDVDFAQFYCAVPFPGSDLYEHAQREGWINTQDWTMFEQNFSVLDTPTLKAADVMRLRGLAYRRFYIRPRMVWRTMKRLRTVAEFRNFARMVRDFLTWV